MVLFHSNLMKFPITVTIKKLLKTKNVSHLSKRNNFSISCEKTIEKSFSLPKLLFLGDDIWNSSTCFKLQLEVRCTIESSSGNLFKGLFYVENWISSSEMQVNNFKVFLFSVFTIWLEHVQNVLSVLLTSWWLNLLWNKIFRPFRFPKM